MKNKKYAASQFDLPNADWNQVNNVIEECPNVFYLNICRLDRIVVANYMRFYPLRFQKSFPRRPPRMVQKSGTCTFLNMKYHEAVGIWSDMKFCVTNISTAFPVRKRNPCMIPRYFPQTSIRNILAKSYR